MRTTELREILVVELLGGFGDLLLALPAVHGLARSHPSARVTVLTFAPGDALLCHDPHVAEVVVAPDHSEGAPRRLVEEVLASRSWDLAVTTTTYDGIGDACRRSAATAVTNLWQGAPDGHLVDLRFLELLHHAGAVDEAQLGAPLRVHLTEDERRAGGEVLTSAGLGGPGTVLLVPGSGMRVKEWPSERWAGLVSRLHEGGARAGTVGAPGTAAVPGTTLLPPGDLRALASTFAALAAAGGAVVGGDTGPVRLATAVGAPAVGLYGPTSAARYGLRPPGTSLQGLPACAVRRPSSITEQECWWSARCPLTGDDPACMADLPVDAVAEAVLRGLAEAAAVAPRA